MTITKTFNESQLYFVGDILNISNMFSLSSGMKLSDVNITILVTSHTNDLILPTDNDGHDNSDLRYSHKGNSAAYIDGVTIDQLGNIGFANDGDFNFPKLKVTSVGAYDITIHTPSFNDFITIRINVHKKIYSVRFATIPALSLGVFGTAPTENVLTLGYQKDSDTGSITNGVGTNFDIYDNSSQVTDVTKLEEIYDKITSMSFRIKSSGITLKVGGTFEVLTFGDYQMDLYSYLSDVFILDFSQIIITVDPKSYSIVRFAEPVNLIYGEKVPDIHTYLTTASIGEQTTPRLSSSDFDEVYSLQLVEDNGNTVSESNIPITPPGIYLLKASFSGIGNGINGLLSVSKAPVSLKTIMNSSYKITDGTLTFTDLFYIETAVDSTKRILETITLTVHFIPSSGGSILIVDPTYTLNEKGTLEIIAVYSGSALYNPARLKVISTVGPIPLDVTSTKKYFLSQSEFETIGRKEEIETDILDNLTITNRVTGEEVNSSFATSIKSFSTITYEATSNVLCYFDVFYTLLNNLTGLEGSILTSSVTSFVNFTNYRDSLEANENTISIKGISVYEGVQLTLNYNVVNTSGIVTDHTSVSLGPSVSGEAYKIDAIIGTTLGATYVETVNSSGIILNINTTDLTYADTLSANFTDLSDLPNGLYKTQLTVAEENLADGIDGIDFNEYSIAMEINENIFVTSEMEISIDLIGYSIDRINATDRNVDYLLEKPHFDYSLGSDESDYTVSSDYLSVTFIGGSSTVSVPEVFLSGLTVSPNLAYVSTVASDSRAFLPYLSETTGLLVHKDNIISPIVPTFKLGLPKMVINGVNSDLDTWFTNNSITLNNPTGVTASDSISTIVENINTNISTLIPEYETLENIVLDTGTINTSRTFWVNLINKLTVLKTKMDTEIRNNPGLYLDNDDIDDFFDYTYNGIKLEVDLSTFESSDLTYLLSVPETYTILIQNEINTLILKKHILASMLLLKYNLLEKLTINYESADFSFTAVLSGGDASIIIPSFTGTYGAVSLTLVVTATNTETATGRIFGSIGSKTITYGSAPSSIIGTYTKVDNTSGSVSLALSSSSGNTFTYAVSESIEIKGSSGISITGLSRSKTVDEQIARRSSEITTVTETMTGTIAVTGSQLTKID